MPETHEFVEAWSRLTNDPLQPWDTVLYECDTHAEQVYKHVSPRIGGPKDERDDAWWQDVTTRRVKVPKRVIDKNKKENADALVGLLKARKRLEQADAELQAEFEARCDALVQEVVTENTRVIPGNASLHVALRNGVTLQDLEKIFGNVAFGARKMDGPYLFCNLEFTTLAAAEKIFNERYNIVALNTKVLKSISKCRDSKWIDERKEIITQKTLECKDTKAMIKLADEINNKMDAPSPPPALCDPPVSEPVLCSHKRKNSEVRCIKVRRSI